MLDLIGDVLEFFLVEWFDWMREKHKVAWVLLEVGVLVLVGGCAVLCLLGGAVVQGVLLALVSLAWLTLFLYVLRRTPTDQHIRKGGRRE